MKFHLDRRAYLFLLVTKENPYGSDYPATGSAFPSHKENKKQKLQQ